MLTFKENTKEYYAAANCIHIKGVLNETYIPQWVGYWVLIDFDIGAFPNSEDQNEQ